MNKLIFFLTCLTLVACQQIPPRTLVYNGNIYTADNTYPKVEAMVLEGENIIFVGPLEDALTLIDPATTETLDLKGRTVIPGFVESHGHFMGMGRMAFLLDLSTAKSFEETLQMVADSAAVRPAGSWIVGRGWHQDKWSDTPELVEG
ncbi:MAG: amidohydrolase family protein, partial [Bacteroidia bacterium]|nr:amidohydrolase family protein [Bacteroidia bacterium]